MAKNNVGYVRKSMAETLPPPAGEIGVIGWIRKNLFSSIPNAIITLVCLWVLYKIVPSFLNWTLFNAVWTGSDRVACATVQQGGALPEDWSGACWAYVGEYLQQFIYGRYPVEELWRPNLVMAMFFAGLIPLAMPSVPFKRENLIFMLGIFPVASFILLTGGHVELNGFLPTGMSPSASKFWFDFIILSAIIIGAVYAYMRGTDTDPSLAVRATAILLAVIGFIVFICSVNVGLEHVETDVWGGFVLTLVIAVTGIVVSLPLGILLALGRRSNMPAVSLISVIFIEFWRGVPLITVLFMSSVMLPLFLPDGVEFDKLMRALIGVALFSSAYMAEVVRGGMQAIPKGQYEGAMAVGLNYWQSMRMIILPQALKIVIPGIVNTFIGLFKDTTLVTVISLLDFFSMINSSLSDPNWATPVQPLTGYLFCAIIFFIFCFGMSRYSIFMENRLNTSHR